MKLLILGGTIFLGRHIVHSALDRGHEVTLFNRGRSGTDLFPSVEKLRGDRDGGLGVLRGRKWDGVIDTSGYVPRLVRDSANLLKDAVAHYSFISTISVYADRQPLGIEENGALQILKDEKTEEITGETYGGLKVLCERAVDSVMPQRNLLVRLGLLVGPHDSTGRFTYWVKRVAEGGEVLAPAPPDRLVQFIDARDAASWIVRMSEEQALGPINVTGPTMTMGDGLSTCAQALRSNVQMTWVDEAFLIERGVKPWSGLPLWTPLDDSGIFAIKTMKAKERGLTCRALAATVADTLQWASQAGDSSSNPKVGLTREREEELLREWHAQ
ncbi:MAG TPA: NAD-dependent epimerase/dehydratase family protein, partial [bacterium]|nr:NAD-dependent epimerase/dehydratase family protein [bacterium]